MSTASKTEEKVEIPAGRSFTPAEANGGSKPDPKTTAIVLIEFQNEFVTEGGKLHDAVKGVMASTKMLENTVDLIPKARALGVKIIHTPITFNEDMSDNPNKNLGILKGCNEGKLFVRGSWGAKICDKVEAVRAKEDLDCVGKRGLDAFPGTNLEKLLVDNGIKTVVLGGLLTNCCVESTMRTAYEKGFDVITLKDCTACTSEEGQKAAIDGTFGMFSTAMTNEELLKAF
jgi:nicotinamidase-related amidase